MNSEARSALTLVIVGLLLVALDFRVNDLDLLPDTVGNLLLAFGCARLTWLSRQFGIAMYLHIVLAFFDLLSLGVLGFAAEILGWIVTFTSIAAMWTLLGGIAEIALRQQRPDFAKRATNLRVAYALGHLCVAVVVILFSDAAIPVALLLVGVLLVLLAMIVLLIFRVRRTFA